MLGLNRQREALKFIAILGVVAYVYYVVCNMQQPYCEMANYPIQKQSEEKQLIEAIDACLWYGKVRTLVKVGWVGCLLYWAWCVGGPRRTQLRKALGIPADDPNGACCSCFKTGQESSHINSDCCLHFWCPCCAVVQETRTVLLTEYEKAHLNGCEALVQAPSGGSGVLMFRAMPAAPNLKEAKKEDTQLPV